MNVISSPDSRRAGRQWILRCGAVAGIVLGSAACAIHPLPEDVTRETTVQIVKKIQCEAREALDDITVEYMRESTQRRTLELADVLEGDKIEVVDMFKRYHRELDPRVVRLAELFTKSSVGMGFEFTITEDNNATAGANFRLPFNPAGDLFTLDLGGGARRTRKSFRKFDVASDFNELHTKLARSDCSGIVAADGNRLYPIAGKIGLKEVFRTFIDLHTVRGAVKERFSDTLTFTTFLDVSATPRITLSPGPIDRFRLAQVNVELTASRLDEHKLAIALERKDIPGAAKRNVLIQLEQLRTEDFFERQRAIERRLNDIDR